MSRFLFPRWSNALLPLLAVVGGITPLYVVFFVAYGFSPKTLEVGYQPKQPVPFSHALHAGELGMDCRYCHNTVERANHAAIPATQTCMNCHSQVWKESEFLEPVRASWREEKPIEWTKVYDLPDYVYFNHSAHVKKGVGCQSCHGDVDEQNVLWQEPSLHMEWCLSCHREPEKYLRPLDAIFDFDYEPPSDQLYLGLSLLEEYDVNPGEDCGICHR